LFNIVRSVGAPASEREIVVVVMEEGSARNPESDLTG
jgi:hypothetical protein